MHIRKHIHVVAVYSGWLLRPAHGHLLTA